MLREFVGCVLVMSDQRRSWARLSAGLREEIGTVDKEELEVVKWNGRHSRKNGNRE